MANDILALDIGSGTIKAVVAEFNDEGRAVLKAGIIRPSKGIRKGSVVDMEAASAQINSVINSIRDISKDSIKNIYLNVGGVDIKSQSSRGIVAVARASSEIYKDDIDRVIQASEAVNLPSNRMILHTIKKEFIVDGIGDIEDPLGMVGARLEVVSYIIDAFQPTVKNLMKCVELSGGSIAGLIFSPLASAESILTKSQKELGTVLIDIGYGTTGIAAYEEGKLLHTKILPIGAGHITNDLAIALKIPVEVAEKLKVSYGYAVAKEVSAKDSVDLKKIDVNIKGAPSRKFISEVIESRLSEICELVNNELKLLGKNGRLPGGAVIVGGGAKMPGIVELFKSELKLATQIGLPSPSAYESATASTMDLTESPEYADVLGLALWSNEINPRPKRTKGLSIFKFIENFLP